jgi:plasmid replication initiation protein
MKNNIVSVSNDLVKAQYELSKVEKRLIICLIASINNNVKLVEGELQGSLEVLDPGKEYSLKTETYAELYGIAYEAAKDELEVAIDKLYERDVKYTLKGEKEIRTRWISSVVRYDKTSHEVSIYWAAGIIPLISELRSNFTSYKVKFLSTLSSIYSIRLYEVFVMELSKSRKSSITLNLTVESIRFMCDLGDKYTLFADFMKRVVEEPVRAINKDGNCNINISLKGDDGKNRYIKEGKKVVGIAFNVSWRSK